jgi:TetR/AcrR family transcriptional regulator
MTIENKNMQTDTQTETKKKMQKDVRQRILDAALKEFSTYGFNGTRMERIATSANITKAMIFYYFSSKKNLYQLVIKQLFDQFSPSILGLLKSNPSPEEFIERMVNIYLGIFSRYPDYVRLLFLELNENTRNLGEVFSTLFRDKTGDEFGKVGPPQLIRMVKKWYSENLITESDPYQLLISIISLTVLSFIGKPFIEMIFRMTSDWTPPDEETFLRDREKSIVNLLKNGFLV